MTPERLAEMEQQIEEADWGAPVLLWELSAKMAAEIRRCWARISDLELMLAPRVGGDEDGIGLV